MILLERHREGVILPVCAAPGARRAEIRDVYQGALKVAVTQAAEKGKANKAIVALLSKTLGIRKSQIQLITGTTATNKRFLIRGVEFEEFAARIERQIAS